MERDLLFLSRQDVERLLTPEACIAAVESAFRQYASGQAAERMLGLRAHDGSFHVKAGIVMGERPYFAAKVNANFPQNGKQFGLPTVQGLVILLESFAAHYRSELAVPIVPVTELARAVSDCDVVITCTTARKYFITREMVRPGTFVAAVGADDESKQEIEPSLLASAIVVTDITA
ncbi:MAG TPA: hypothetical protein VFS06_03060 [Casimicrobiaceae bacterium]|jgi:ornithine cyclodeaminase/alanine dehydrogenase-like protein (mu-crystallin family)|nr:hypothetical protein [Casimicrobiaceae bacterium]